MISNGLPDFHKTMNRTVTIGLIATCIILVVICIVLTITIYKLPRFVPTKGENPYIMFDKEKTNDIFEPYQGKENIMQPPPGLPSCKDL